MRCVDPRLDPGAASGADDAAAPGSTPSLADGYRALAERVQRSRALAALEEPERSHVRRALDVPLMDATAEDGPALTDLAEALGVPAPFTAGGQAVTADAEQVLTTALADAAAAPDVEPVAQRLVALLVSRPR